MIDLLKWVLFLPHKLYKYNIRPRFNRFCHYSIRLFRNILVKNSSIENEFSKRLSRYKVAWDQKNVNIVLTQIVDDYTMCVKLAATANFLATKQKSNIGLYSIGLYSIYSRAEEIKYFGKGIFGKMYAASLYKRLNNVFMSFGGKIVHQHIFDYEDQQIIQSHFIKIKDRIARKEDVLKIEVEGIVIGDLIYDTFLRFNNSATLDIQTPFLDKTILQALNIYFNCKEVFLKYEVKALVSTYTSYIYHGIIVRMCLKKDIPVYNPICGFYTLIHKVLKEYPSHYNNHFLFPDIFKLVKNRDKAIDSARDVFEKRFSGQVDEATFYMKESAFSNYQNVQLNELNWSNTVVVLAHCFFENPHCYRDLLFPDFYEWITYTLDVLSMQKNINVLVKPHPNGVQGNDEVFDALKEKYCNTNITFIDKKTSQLQIMNSQPKAIITAYGTAAAECAYLGFPVITIYDHPFIAYDFTYTARTIEEYNKLLQNVLHLKPKQKKDEILEYFYMQHVFFMQGRESNYLKFDKYFGQATNSDNFLQDYLPQMDELYFKMLDDSVKDGFELAEWESNIIRGDRST